MPVFVVVTQNERDFTKNEGHFPEFKQNVDHAFETVAVEEIFTVLAQRVFNDLRAVGQARRAGRTTLRRSASVSGPARAPVG